MNTVVAVSALEDWRLSIPGVELVAAGDYLCDPAWQARRGVRVYNLCRTYRYQSTGYYVSLLATARGHKPVPDLSTVLDMRSRTLVRAADDELDELVQKSLARIQGDRFTLSVYFGRNLAERYARLSRALFDLFRAPLLRAHFVRDERWRLSSIGPISARDIPEQHLAFVEEAAQQFFDRPHWRGRRSNARFDLAILWDPDEELAPSNEKALRKFERAGAKLGFAVERIQKEDYSRLGEFDALFIRETTRVNHHTFRFAQRAQAEGLAVIDDPQSILRCTNKVYLAERLGAKRVPIPRTVLASKETADRVQKELGLPCVLKTPDGSFSQGVVRAETPEELDDGLRRILAESDLLVAQEYLPTEYDWRVGVFEGELLFACRYHMARGHWQIVQQEIEREPRAQTTAATRTKFKYGRVESVPLLAAPDRVLAIARRAARAIGDGLYGVDLKEARGKVYVMEVNDNPNIDAGCEDEGLGDALYERILSGLLRRVVALKEGGR